jgi:predicted transcriptional regulator of viral defense system
MKDREATRAIRELAERQHGVVARRQLLELGAGERLNQVRAEAGLLIPLFQGVFAVGHRRIGQRGHWMAAVLASGPGAVLSHGSAMELWGMRRSTGPVEVLRHSGGPRYNRRDIRLHQTRKLLDRHITDEQGIPVTTIERTLLDMAGRLGARQLERALVTADRGGRVRWPELQRMVVRGKGKKGIGRLRRVVAQVDPRAAETISPVEVDFLALCREFDLPLPQVNVLVEGYLVDFYWPAQGVIVETDSYTYHGDRPAFERDHERTVALTAAGYEVHRATRLMLSRNPDPFLELVRRTLNQRQPQTASTSLPARSRS